MKESPHEKKIHNNLKPGQITKNGFLGKDKRRYTDIISEDKALLTELNLTEKEIAERMQYFTDKAFEHYDGSITIDDKYKVEYNSFRGKIICPFAHPGVYRKGNITITNLENKTSISWTPLNIHMIKAHCFFEGKSSENRLDPAKLKKVIF